MVGRSSPESLVLGVYALPDRGEGILVEVKLREGQITDGETEQDTPGRQDRYVLCFAGGRQD